MAGFRISTEPNRQAIWQGDPHKWPEGAYQSQSGNVVLVMSGSVAFISAFSVRGGDDDLREEYASLPKGTRIVIEVP